jgi:hypothetical protein
MHLGIGQILEECSLLHTGLFTPSGKAPFAELSPRPVWILWQAGNVPDTVRYGLNIKPLETVIKLNYI